MRGLERNKEGLGRVLVKTVAVFTPTRASAHSYGQEPWASSLPPPRPPLFDEVIAAANTLRFLPPHPALFYSPLPYIPPRQTFKITPAFSL